MQPNKHNLLLTKRGHTGAPIGPFVNHLKYTIIFAGLISVPVDYSLAQKRMCLKGVANHKIVLLNVIRNRVKVGNEIYKDSNYLAERIDDAVVKLEGQEVRLTSLLSPFAKKVHLLPPKPFQEGNCFNATVGWFKGNYRIEETFDKDLLDFLSHKARKVLDKIPLVRTEFLRSEDIVLIFGKNSDGNRILFHSYIYLLEGFIWHKPSISPEDLHSFALHSEIQKFYEQALANRGMKIEIEVWRHIRNIN
ncbi:MAG: hypothetical protein KDD61_00085 [Bdellovibrionales bacterium]|nr:hypothetical protein [Bdellovibrionales bacterium]